MRYWMGSVGLLYKLLDEICDAILGLVYERLYEILDAILGLLDEILDELFNQVPEAIVGLMS